MFKIIIKFFDKLEDKIRGKLSKRPIIYALIGSIGIILVWRGVWHMADDVGMGSVTSFILGVVILLLIGLFVSFFIGEQIIISGIRKEKRTDEKTEEEIQKEGEALKHIEREVDEIKEELNEIKNKPEQKNN